MFRWVRWAIFTSITFLSCVGYEDAPDPARREPPPPAPPHARLIGHVKSWHQELNNGQYGNLTVVIHLENVGDQTASYYEAFYFVALANGDTISDWTNGLNLPPGHSVDVQGYTLILSHARVDAVWLYDIDWNE